MKALSSPCLLAIAIVGMASLPVAAATPTGPDSLSSQAKLARPAAERIALAKVPSGVVQSAELERENGTLVWSFDIATPGSKDIHEVQVDANSGAVVASEIETPEAQARERAADRREKAAAAHKH